MDLREEWKLFKRWCHCSFAHTNLSILNWTVIQTIYILLRTTILLMKLYVNCDKMNVDEAYIRIGIMDRQNRIVVSCNVQKDETHTVLMHIICIIMCNAPESVLFFVLISFIYLFFYFALVKFVSNCLVRIQFKFFVVCLACLHSFSSALFVLRLFIYVHTFIFHSTPSYSLTPLNYDNGYIALNIKNSVIYIL